MSVRQAITVVGTVVGAYFGAPQLGFIIGSAIGNAVDPQIINGPKIGDIATQTSQEGVPRPFIFGMSPPMAGNIIASGPPRKITKTKSQGKGGPKVKTESVLRTYAIGICEGPITKVLRVWRNSELVWDAKKDEEVNYHDFTGKDAIEWIFRRLTNNTVWAQKIQFFYGTYTQEPPQDLEQIFGVGQTPAHRGTAYMLVSDDDLTDLRGAIPQYMFQVEKGIDADEIVVFTQDGLWEKPDFLVEAEVTVIAGGAGGRGGGGHSALIPASGGGGGGGGISVQTFEAADLPASVIVTVGAGGAGGAGGNSSTLGSLGGVGGDSSFGAFLSAAGGEIGASQAGGDGGAGDTEDGGHGGAGAFGPITGLGEHGTPGESMAIGPGGGGGGGPVDNLVSTISGPGEAGEGGDAGTVQGGAAGVGVVILSGNATAVGLPGGAGGDSDQFGPGGGGGGGGAAGHSGTGQARAGDGGRGGLYGGGGGGGGTGSRGGSAINSFGGDGGSGGGGVVVVRQTFENLQTDLADIVTELCARANLPAELIDVSLLSGTVPGYAVINTYPAIEALRALSQIYLFEAVNYDGKVHFIPRGRNIVATITEDDLLDDDQDIERERRSDPMTIPRVLNLNYYSVLGGLAPDKQTSERSGDRRANGEQQLQTAVVLDDETAAKVAAITHKVMIEDQKGELEFSLPDKWLGLIPTDCIALGWEGRTERLRLSKVENFDGYQQYIALRDRQSAYTSVVQALPASPTQLPANQSVGPTLLEIMDLPILRDVDDGVGLSLYIAIAGLTDAWQGAEVEFSLDGGQNYIESDSVSTPTVIGELVTDMSDHPAEYPDDLNVVLVRILTLAGELEPVDEAELFNGLNMCCIGDELVQFANAQETTTEGVWEISYFLRGRKATTTATHPAGTRFVMTGNLIPIPASVTHLERQLTFRATSIGAPVDTGTVKTIVYHGFSQLERAVGYLEAHRVGSDLVATWQGVGRLGSGVNAAQGPHFAGYRVTIADIGSNSFTVDQATTEITHDVTAFASPITVTVVQLNDLTGEGQPAEVEIV